MEEGGGVGCGEVTRRYLFGSSGKWVEDVVMVGKRQGKYKVKIG